VDKYKNKKKKSNTSKKTGGRKESSRKNKLTAISSSMTRSFPLPLTASETKDPREPELNLQFRRLKKEPLFLKNTEFHKNPKANSTNKLKKNTHNNT
jgi:hypothetical protein